MVINIYRPPTGNLTEFSWQLTADTIQLQMDNLQSFHNVEVFVLGDFNIDIKNSRDPNGKRLINMCQVHGLQQLIKDTSRYGLTKTSIIDLIFSNIKHINPVGYSMLT